VIGLDSLINAIQWRHHDVSTEHVPLSEYIAVHDLGLEGTLLFLCPLADPALRADGRHDSTKEPTRIFAKNNPQKNILVSVTKIWQNNNSNKKDFCKNKNIIYHNFSPKNIIAKKSQYASHKFNLSPKLTL
jgi:hypothetical protein